MENLAFIDITPDNAGKEGLFCIRNPKYPGFQLKLDWLKARQKEGLKMKLLKVDNETVGFIEYVPGEYSWRPVRANHYMFIQCMWVFPKKNLGKGYGSLLIEECERDAGSQNKAGLLTVSSEDVWLSKPAVFIKNGFKTVMRKDRYQLMLKAFKEADPPEFLPWDENLSKYNGLHLIYANQCPLFIKSVDEMKKTAREKGIELNVTILDSPAQIRQSASGYGVYSLVYNGKLLADHYISNTRFINILNKELN